MVNSVVRKEGRLGEGGALCDIEEKFAFETFVKEPYLQILRIPAK
jgi:hypothetical protein